MAKIMDADAAGGLAPDASAGLPHIRVAVRVRPCPVGDRSIIETAGQGGIAVQKDAATGGNQFLSSQCGRTEERSFDRVFGPTASQSEVFELTCQPLITSAVEQGRSATVFVYGATGAGKTHTMFGAREEAQQGMIHRAVREVFQQLECFKANLGRDGSRLEVKVSFLEIYNEVVRDLLKDGCSPCKVLEDERKGVVKVTNLEEVLVQNVQDVLQLLQSAIAARKTEATGANSRSSRSHAVFTIRLERICAGKPTQGSSIFNRKDPDLRRLHASISLIDLAGSERATQTRNVGAALRDGAKINQSLLALANCIDALVSASQPLTHRRAQTPTRKAPYRDSKLTLLLKASLTGSCCVSMIANVHPGQSHFEDTNNTLEYAKRASTIRSTVVVRTLPSQPLPLQPSEPSSPLDTQSSSPSSAPEDTSPIRIACEQPQQENSQKLRTPRAGMCIPGCWDADAAGGLDDGGSSFGTAASTPQENNHLRRSEGEEGRVDGSETQMCSVKIQAEPKAEDLPGEAELRCTSSPHRRKAVAGRAGSSPQRKSRCATNVQRSPPLSPAKARPGSPAVQMAPPLGAAKGGAFEPSIGQLLAMVETLQAEKQGLNRQVSVLEKENLRLRQFNLEKDQQLASFLPKRTPRVML